MTNIKRYQAATTREALEMVKQDLGEDAFVLETKRVTKRRLLGLRSQMRVEVSAAAPQQFAELAGDVPAPREAAPWPPTKTYSRKGILSLNDDTPAAPAREQAKNERLVETLNSRSMALGTEPTPFEPVELNPEPAKPGKAKQESPRVEPAAERPAHSATARDVELLRAEIRELKFTFGSLSSRQNDTSWAADIDLDVFGEIFDPAFHGIYTELMRAGVSGELARKFVADVIPILKSSGVDKSSARATLMRALSAYFRFERDPIASDRNVMMAMVGSTGVGKTTTIAKLAAGIAIRERQRVELVTLDTYRIAAVDQLKTYAEIIGARCHVVRSVPELDQTLERLSSTSTVLIDTTGRSPHDLADQYELSEYLSGRGDIRKCLVIQATTNPLDAIDSVRKFEMYGADCLAVTKFDETTRPGAVLETLSQVTLPVTYLCTGQRVPEDLHNATAQNLTAQILRTVR